MTLYFISDTHFSHSKMVHVFKLDDGSPARNFASIEEHDETIIGNWNAVVKPEDHVYHLGDVTMKGPVLDTIMPRLNGHLRLIRGNHDICKTDKYLKYFDEIMGCRVFDNILFTHIPIAPWCMGRFRANVHGHTHSSDPLVYTVINSKQVMYASRSGHRNIEEPKPRIYMNISVEQTNYAPMSLDDIRAVLHGEEERNSV